MGLDFALQLPARLAQTVVLSNELEALLNMRFSNKGSPTEVCDRWRGVARHHAKKAVFDK